MRKNEKGFTYGFHAVTGKGCTKILAELQIPFIKKVDWDKSYAGLLPRIKQVVEEMGQGKPQRIIWSTVGSRLESVEVFKEEG